MSDTPPPPPPPPYLPPPPPPGAGSAAGGFPPAPTSFGTAAPGYGEVLAGMQVPPSPPRRSGKAVAALVLGLGSVLLFITVAVPILAIVFGLLGAREVKRSAGRRTGLAIARVGWILGALGLVGAALAWVEIASEIVGTTAVSELEVGDCVDLPDENEEVSRLDTFDCDEPHDGEVFSVGDLGDGDDPYPGAVAIDDLMAEICIPAFEDYVGTAYGEGELDVFRLYPLEDNWEFDQGYVCLVVLQSRGKLTESVEGSQR